MTSTGSVEHEVKLRAHPSFELPPFGGLTGAAVVPQPAQSLETVYYDTRDLRLARWGISVRCRTGDAKLAPGVGRWTVKLPEGDDGPAIVRREIVVDAPTRVIPDEVSALVRAYVRSSLLAPVAVLRSDRRRHLVRVDSRDVVEIDDDTVSVVDEGRVVLTFREIEVERLAGAPTRAVRHIVQALCNAGAELTQGTNKLVQALGPDVLGAPDVVVPDLSPRARIGDVVRAAIASGTERLLRHDPGVRLGADPEDVHQARVATRRLRSDLRTFRHVLDREPVQHLRRELGWLADLLGAVRDSEVLLARLREHVNRLPLADVRGGTALVRRLEREWEAAREALLAALAGDRYLALLELLVSTSRRPPLVDGADERASDVLEGVVDREVRTLAKAVDALPDDPDDQQLHAIRIRAKRARYAVEASAAVCGKRARKLAKAIAALQGTLGDLNDAVVAEAWLRSAGARASGAEAFAAGALAAIERDERAAARDGWHAAWKAVRHEQRRWRS